jgi:hypothetical protein
VIALEKEMGREMRVAPEPGVTRQEDASLAAGAGHQRPAAEVWSVGHVVTEDAQPAGEPPEHPVGREPRSATRLPHAPAL